MGKTRGSYTFYITSKDFLERNTDAPSNLELSNVPYSLYENEDISWHICYVWNKKQKDIQGLLIYCWYLTKCRFITYVWINIFIVLFSRINMIRQRRNILKIITCQTITPITWSQSRDRRKLPQDIQMRTNLEKLLPLESVQHETVSKV